MRSRPLCAQLFLSSTPTRNCHRNRNRDPQRAAVTDVGAPVCRKKTPLLATQAWRFRHSFVRHERDTVELGSESGGRDGEEGAGTSAGEMFGAHGVRSGGGLLVAWATHNGHMRVGPTVVFLVLIVVLMSTVTGRRCGSVWGGVGWHGVESVFFEVRQILRRFCADKCCAVAPDISSTAALWRLVIIHRVEYGLIYSHMQSVVGTYHMIFVGNGARLIDVRFCSVLAVLKGSA